MQEIKKKKKENGMHRKVDVGKRTNEAKKQHNS